MFEKNQRLFHQTKWWKTSKSESSKWKSEKGLWEINFPSEKWTYKPKGKVEHHTMAHGAQIHYSDDIFILQLHVWL